MVPWPTILSYFILQIKVNWISKALRKSLAEFIFCICFRGVIILCVLLNEVLQKHLELSDMSEVLASLGTLVHFLLLDTECHGTIFFPFTSPPEGSEQSPCLTALTWIRSRRLDMDEHSIFLILEFMF